MESTVRCRPGALTGWVLEQALSGPDGRVRLIYADLRAPCGFPVSTPDSGSGVQLDRPECAKAEAFGQAGGYREQTHSPTKLTVLRIGVLTTYFKPPSQVEHC